MALPHLNRSIKMDSRLTELVQKEIKTLLKEYSEAVQNIDAVLPQGAKKKMREIMSIRIANKALQLAEWAIAGDGEKIDKFFLDMIQTVNKKYGKYEDPEEFTTAEKAAIAKFELLSKRNIKISDHSATYISPEQGQWTIYKNLYADGKRLAYFVSRNGKVQEKSKPFSVEKGHALRELLNLMKSVWQY